MLRNSKYHYWRDLCGQNCFKEAYDEDQSKGENDPGNSDSQVSSP